MIQSLQLLLSGFVIVEGRPGCRAGRFDGIQRFPGASSWRADATYHQTEIPVNHLFQQYAILKNAIREMGGYKGWSGNRLISILHFLILSSLHGYTVSFIKDRINPVKSAFVFYFSAKNYLSAGEFVDFVLLTGIWSVIGKYKTKSGSALSEIRKGWIVLGYCYSRWRL